MRVKTAGITDEQVVAYTWSGNEVSWTLVSSGQQKSQDGSYTLVPKGDDTLVKFELTRRPDTCHCPASCSSARSRERWTRRPKGLRKRVLKVKKGK